jgi:Acetyltransferase (GNAT) domain
MTNASASSSGNVCTKVYRDFFSLEELRGFWSSRETSPAGDLDFYRTVTCASSEFVRPHVIVLFKEDRPLSLLLGRLERTRINVRLGYLRVPTPRLDILTFDDGGWLSDISVDDSNLLVRNILDSLRTGEADAAELQHLDTAGPLYHAARAQPGRLSSDHFPLLQTHWLGRVPDNGTLLDNWSKRRRYKQRRRARLLFDAFAGNVRIERYHDGARVEQLMQHAEAVAKTSYQRGLGVGFVNDERSRNRLRLEAQHRTLRAYVLYLGDTPCAFWVGSLRAKVFYLDFFAFDPAYARYEPGTYLAIKVIEELCDNHDGAPVSAIDFGLGDAQYKAVFGNYQRQLASLYIFAPTVKGAALNLLRALFTSVDRSTKTLLERSGVLSRVKRTWRRQVTANPS